MFRNLLSFLAMACACLAVSAKAEKHVALVFDDGPSVETNAKLLEVLRKQHVTVTFANVAQRLVEHPELGQQIVEAGHEIANHSFEHRNADELDDAQLRHEIVDAQQKMAEILPQAPKWYWPPYLKINDRIRSAVDEAGIELYEPANIVVSMDYDKSVPSDEIYRRATSGVTNGSVILFHEWREETAERLPEILHELRNQGCVFLTFSGLDAAMHPERT